MILISKSTKAQRNWTRSPNSNLDHPSNSMSKSAFAVGFQTPSRLVELVQLNQTQMLQALHFRRYCNSFRTKWDPLKMVHGTYSSFLFYQLWCDKLDSFRRYRRRLWLYHPCPQDSTPTYVRLCPLVQLEKSQQVTKSIYKGLQGFDSNPLTRCTNQGSHVDLGSSRLVLSSDKENLIRTGAAFFILRGSACFFALSYLLPRNFHVLHKEEINMRRSKSLS